MKYGKGTILSVILLITLFSFSLKAQVFTAHTGFGKYLSQGLAWGDYDNDGYQDIYITNGGQTQTGVLRWENFLYHNKGDGTFDSVATGAPVTDVSGSGGCCWGDYDNDGDLDLIVAEGSHRETSVYYSKNSFYENDGDGTFTSITNSPVTTETVSGFGGSGFSRITIGWTDLNNDGWLDIFESNAMFNSIKQNNTIWQSDGDGTFTEITNSLATDQTARSGFSWIDFDNDGDLDVVTASGKPAAETNLWVNTSTGWTKYNFIGTGTNIGRSAAGISWADYDNDGDFDLFIAVTRDNNDTDWEPDRLYRNDTSNPDTPVFTQMTTANVGAWLADSSLSYSSAWGDYNNDGYVDLFVGNDGPYGEGYRNFLILNDGDGTFTKVTDGAINDSTFIRAAAWADFDNDGDLDLISGRDGKNILFKNSGNSNHYLNVKLVDTRTNTNTTAFGSRVEVYAPSRQIREVTSLTGLGGQNSLRRHFGLGSVTTVDSVVVKWLNNSSGKTRTHTAYSHLPADKFMIYTYGDLNVTASVLASRTFMYLFGNSGAALDFTANSDTDGGSLTIQRFSSKPTNNTFSGSATAPDATTVTPNVVAPDRYWTISESGLTGNFTCTVYLDITNLPGVSNANKLLIVSRANSTAAWQPYNTQRMGNTLYAANISSFSEWTIAANSADNSLPVELLSFKAQAGDGEIILNWKTASEVENLGFIIERKTGQRDFEEIASYKTDDALTGQGNSSRMHEYSFTDEDVINGRLYTYQLSDVSYSGKKTVLNTVRIRPEIKIKDFKLYANYPNPFNPGTVIRYQAPKAGNVEIVIYNSLGQTVKQLVNGRKEKGIYEVTFEAGGLASGVYFYMMRSGNFVQVRKMLLMR